jgi:hypothetical protein
LTNLFFLPGLRIAFEVSAMQVEVLQMAYNSSQQDLGLLEQAALEVCQSIDEGTG